MMAVAERQRVATISELRARTGELVTEVMTTKRPLRITRHKQPAAVLMDIDEYERLNYEREFFVAIAEGRTAAAEGRVRPHAEVMKEMRQWLKKPTK